MKLSQNPIFKAEDFPDFKDADALFQMLNPYVAQLNQAFDHNFTYDDNFHCMTKSFTQKGITVPVKFLWSYPKFTPLALDIVKAKIDGTPAAFACAWDFDASNSTISISSIFQLAVPDNIAVNATSNYQFTVRVLV